MIGIWAGGFIVRLVEIGMEHKHSGMMDRFATVAAAALWPIGMVIGIYFYAKYRRVDS